MSVSLATLESIKTKLKEAKDLGLPIQQDLYTHLTEVFSRIALHTSNDGYAQFEQVSELVKKHNFKLNNTKTDDEVNKQANLLSNADALRLIEKSK
jgi:hypothetical protein